MNGITMVLKRSEAQEAALQALLAAQQDPTSPQYHHWLTPDQFGAQFGVADADIAKVETWLQGQGFTVNRVARSRNQITFSGSAGQVAAAFGTELHQYRTGTETHFAPAKDLSVPAALAPMVAAVLRLSDFRLKPMLHVVPAAAKAQYTDGTTGHHFLTPQDVATMYDVNSVYKSGYTGAGQAIAIIGQSDVILSDISAFQSGAGLPANLPVPVLVPDTGQTAVFAGDESESDLDLEYASGMAPGATIYFVHVGDDTNSGVIDALAYAITEDIAPVVSLSYGQCEALLLNFSTYVAQNNALYEQAGAQGQTLIVSSGDSGSTACAAYNTSDGIDAATQFGLAVDFPADSPFVTAIGGTEMQPGTFSPGSSSYWNTTPGTTIENSLISYVPESVWNEDSAANGIAAGGGGTSILFNRPTWQAGVPGIPTGTARLVPDVSLLAGSGTPGYILCSSDTDILQQEKLTSSCTNGLTNASKQYLIAGGTSFGAPIFAGLVAVLNQQKQSLGQGNINPTLYSLASNGTTYSSVFHDVSAGTNACTAGSGYCSSVGASEYAAATGYDEATGLGTIDFANLLAKWPAGTSLTASLTTVTASTNSPNTGASDTLTITVTGTGSAGPTGTVQIALDGVTQGTAVALSNGTATYTFPGSTTTGAHVITALYSGDATFEPSRGSDVITVLPTGSFAVGVGNITLTSGGAGSSTVTVTPSGGYLGDISWSLSSDATINNACYSLNSVQVTGTAPISQILTIGIGAACTTGAAVSPARAMRPLLGRARASNQPLSSPWKRAPEMAALAGLMAFGYATRRRAGRLRLLPVLGLLALAAGLGLSGCGGSAGSSPTAPTGPTGSTGSTGTTGTSTTYNLTLIGVDSVSSTISASANFTLTVNQ